MFRELEVLFPKAVDSFFELNSLPYNCGATEYYDTPEAIVYKFDLPGVQKDDVAVDTEVGFIKVTWTRKMPEPKPALTSKKYGTYTYKVPTFTTMDLDSIKAEMKDGVLSVTVSKSVKKKSAIKVS